MPNVSWTLTVQIGGGSSVATSADPVDVEAVDRIEVEVAAGAAVHLTEPQLYTAGAIALFARAPKSLKVSNAGVAPVTLEILVARDATP
jgi:hypothetical protein